MKPTQNKHWCWRTDRKKAASVWKLWEQEVKELLCSTLCVSVLHWGESQPCKQTSTNLWGQNSNRRKLQESWPRRELHHNKTCILCSSQNEFDLLSVCSSQCSEETHYTQQSCYSCSTVRGDAPDSWSLNLEPSYPNTQNWWDLSAQGAVVMHVTSCQIKSIKQASVFGNVNGNSVFPPLEEKVSTKRFSVTYTKLVLISLNYQIMSSSSQFLNIKSIENVHTHTLGLYWLYWVQVLRHFRILIFTYI